MNTYEDNALREMILWKKEMTKLPSFQSKFAKTTQDKLNSFIPEKAHEIITAAIKNMVKAVLLGSEYITSSPLYHESLEHREILVKKKAAFYKQTATISGAGTGAGGLILGLADFPILLSLKIKFLFDTSSLYSFNVKNYKERLYILYVFQLAFSSQQRRNEIFKYISDWDAYSASLPENEENFDWRIFQQEYRDYIDIAKMLQLLPGIGAFVGAYANYKLMDALEHTAVNAYRMRVFNIE